MLSAIAGQQLIDGLRPEHLTGSINEHLAAAYFMSKGYAVYWPAAQQSHVDFVIQSAADGFQRVQVKTGTWSKTGKFKYLQARLMPCGVRKNGGKFDPKTMYDLLMVISDSGWWVIPAAQIDSTNISLLSTGPKEYRKWDTYRVNRSPP